MATNGMAFALWSLTFLAGLMPSVNAQSLIENPPTRPPPHEKQAPAAAKNLKVFDTLDYDALSHQTWDRVRATHGVDIVVIGLEGHARSDSGTDVVGL